MQGPVPFPEGPVRATEPGTRIQVVEEIWPFYEVVRRVHFGLAAGADYRPPTRGAKLDSHHARWSPAEVAILLWHHRVQHRLVDREGFAFNSVKELVAEMRSKFTFRRNDQHVMACHSTAFNGIPFD